MLFDIGGREDTGAYETSRANNATSTVRLGASEEDDCKREAHFNGIRFSGLDTPLFTALGFEASRPHALSLSATVLLPWSLLGILARHYKRKR